jgi:hypothetical protein
MIGMSKCLREDSKWRGMQINMYCCLSINSSKMSKELASMKCIVWNWKYNLCKDSRNNCLL